MKEITAYAVRIAGLILIVTTLSKFPIAFYAYTTNIENSALTYFISLSIPLVAGAILFKFPNSFSDKFISLSSNSTENIDTNQYLYLGTILIGIILLFFSLSDTIFHVSNYILLKSMTDDEITILNYDYPAAIATIVELIFSGSLIFKSKAIVGFINYANRI